MDMLAAIAHFHGLTLSQLLALGERKYKRRSKKKDKKHVIYALRFAGPHACGSREVSLDSR